MTSKSILYLIHKAMKIKFKYFTIWGLFILSLAMVWYSFVYRDWIPDLDQKLTLILASFGILFTIFQYSMSSQRDQDRYLSQLRIDEYRQIRLSIQEFINNVNLGLSDNVSLIETESKLINNKNELAVLIKDSNSTLFRGLMQEESSKRLDEIFERILIEASKARKEYQKLDESTSPTKNFALEVIKMNWDKTIREDFKESFSVRDKLFHFLQSQILF